MAARSRSGSLRSSRSSRVVRPRRLMRRQHPHRTRPDPADAKAYYALPPGAACRLGDLDARHARARTAPFLRRRQDVLHQRLARPSRWDAATLKLLRQYRAAEARHRLAARRHAATAGTSSRMGDQDVHVREPRRRQARAHDSDRPPPRVLLALTGRQDDRHRLVGGRSLLGTSRPANAASSSPSTPAGAGRIRNRSALPPLTACRRSCSSRSRRTGTVASAAAGDVVRGWDVKTGKPCGRSTATHAKGRSRSRPMAN